jgi:hypothetical protein
MPSFCFQSLLYLHIKIYRTKVFGKKCTRDKRQKANDLLDTESNGARQHKHGVENRRAENGSPPPNEALAQQRQTPALQTGQRAAGDGEQAVGVQREQKGEERGEVERAEAEEGECVVAEGGDCGCLWRRRRRFAEVEEGEEEEAEVGGGGEQGLEAEEEEAEEEREADEEEERGGARHWEQLDEK